MSKSLNLDKETIREKIFSHKETRHRGSKIVFAPRSVTPENIDEVCEAYAEVRENKFETVIVVESYHGELDKAIPMISDMEFKTPFGPVPGNEQMRQDFCDEEDDFFIDDEGKHEHMGVYNHLGVVKCFRDDFDGVCIQLADERPAIVRELVYVLKEVLAYRNVLLVFCCSLSPDNMNEFEQIKTVVRTNDISGLMNYTFSGRSKIEGAGVFVAGVSVAREWELDIDFIGEKYEHAQGCSMLAGSAGFKKAPA